MCFAPCSFSVRLLWRNSATRQSSVRVCPVDFSREAGHSPGPETRNLPRVEYSLFIKLVVASSRKDKHITATICSDMERHSRKSNARKPQPISCAVALRHRHPESKISSACKGGGWKTHGPRRCPLLSRFGRVPATQEFSSRGGPDQALRVRSSQSLRTKCCAAQTGDEFFTTFMCS